MNQKDLFKDLEYLIKKGYTNFEIKLSKNGYVIIPTKELRQ